MSDQVYKDVTDDEFLEILLWHEQMAEWDRISALSRAEQRGVEKGVAALILDNLEEGKTKEQIIAKLQKRFGLGVAQAKAYYEAYHTE